MRPREHRSSTTDGLTSAFYLEITIMNHQNKISNLLLIDDDPSMVRLLETVIGRSCGDKVAIESQVAPVVARERLEEGVFDILLTDLEMPDVDGIELLRFAKKRNASTQVLFLTGNSCHEALLEALEQGAADYLLKPVDHDLLKELVTQAYERNQRWKQALAETWRQRRQAAEVGA